MEARWFLCDGRKKRLDWIKQNKKNKKSLFWNFVLNVLREAENKHSLVEDSAIKSLQNT